MKFPLILASQGKEVGLNNWKRQFLDVDRSLHEGIWRRTQAKVNSLYSNWKSKKDNRWRVVHFLDNYDIQVSGDKSSLVLLGSYLKINHSLPKVEALELYGRYTNCIRKNKKVDIISITSQEINCQLEELSLHIKLLKKKAEKDKFIVKSPKDYFIVDVEIHGGIISVSENKKIFPWKIINKGFRVPLKRGNPTYVSSPKEILNYEPFQVELGCGASIGAGILPLSYLHNIYQTTNKTTKKFVFGKEDHLFEEIIKSPSAFYKKATKIIYKSWKCNKGLKFYSWLKDTYDTGIIVGPIITNNYDGLVSRVGIPEVYIRKFTDQFLTPKIDFNPKAKSLLVIGSHADRRLIQQAARKKNMQVIFVDPEKYIDENGKIYIYPIEAPQDGDIIYKASANEFASNFTKITNKYKD